MLKSLFIFYSIGSCVAIEEKLICFFIDLPEKLSFKKDTSIALMQAVQTAGYQVAYFCFHELFYENGSVNALVHLIDQVTNQHVAFNETEQRLICLYDVAAVIIRKDPPFDQNYLYATYLLDLVAEHKVIVSNTPQSIRDVNEKIFATHFSHLMVETMISSDLSLLQTFLAQHQKIVLKILNNYGGKEIIFLDAQQRSTDMILAMMTQFGARPILAQKFIPEVLEKGNKRIFLINGIPMPFVVVNTSPTGNFIVNGSAGGIDKVEALSEEDRTLCKVLTQPLQNKGLDLVGIDVINGYLTEINVTSPSGFVAIMQETNFDIAKAWWDQIDARLKNR